MIIRPMTTSSATDTADRLSDAKGWISSADLNLHWTRP